MAEHKGDKRHQCHVSARWESQSPVTFLTEPVGCANSVKSILGVSKVSAVELDAEKNLSRTLRKSAKVDDYLFNHRSPAKVFKTRFLIALTELGLPHLSSQPQK